jgi:hypothetical protein
MVDYRVRSPRRHSPVIRCLSRPRTELPDCPANLPPEPRPLRDKLRSDLGRGATPQLALSLDGRSLFASGRGATGASSRLTRRAAFEFEVATKTTHRISRTRVACVNPPSTWAILDP